MIMAESAIEPQAKESLPGMLYDVTHPSVVVEREPTADQVASRDDSVIVRRVQFVGGDHLADHLVVSFSLVEGVDDPISPAPNVWVTVSDISHGTTTVPVAVAPDVHPVSSPTLAILGALQELVNDLAIMLIARIL